MLIMIKAAFICAAFALLFSPCALAGGNTTNDSFSRAKKMLEREVYSGHAITIYCGAAYDKNKDVALPAGFLIPGHAKRAQKMEWEHAVPAENFGRAFREWREGDPKCVDRRGKAFRGRDCASKANEQYRFMQADMYNLFPSIGAVNAVRGNRQYSELSGKHPDFGSCEAKVEGNRFEPPARAKGQVARASLYMDDSYPIFNLSRQQRRLFEAWDKEYPVDEWECARAKRIEKLQGNENARVKNPCIERGMY